MTDWFCTATGRTAYAYNPDREVVCIEDIALSLSRQCRFAGHLKPGVTHYSVAQHSVLVSYRCNPENALIGLLHDAAEAYTQDIIRPIKRGLPVRYLVAQEQWAYEVGFCFGLGESLVDLPDDVKRADEALLATERRDLMNHGDRDWQLREPPMDGAIHPWSSDEAHRIFMRRFGELVGAK